ncbi:MAG TPA: rhodanese-like domain-containing protein [Lactobacillaceae bacterium]|jgi:rhodanese-related sulfurtransferase
MTQILLLIVYVIAIWVVISLLNWAYMFWTVKQSGTLITPENFAQEAHNGQIIDVREPAAYKRSHIIGARNIPVVNFSQGKAGLRFDKGIYLYDDNTRLAVQAAKRLKKQGYAKEQIFVLKQGFNAYPGKKS